MYCEPCGETTSTGAPSSTESSITPGTDTRDGVTTSPPERRNERSENLVPSQTAHHAAVAGPIRATAAHSISSGPNAPTHVQRLSGRRPRQAAMRSGGNGKRGRSGPGPLHALTAVALPGRYAQPAVD